MAEPIEITASIDEKIGARSIRVKTSAGTKICAGIVGAGLMGRWHAHALEKVGGQVVGVADFDIARAEKLAAIYRNAKGFEDIDEMLEAQNLDVLHVCSPTASHEAIAEKAIQAGVHLLIEKPVTATTRETIKLYDLASQNNTLLCPVHQFAFQNGVAKAKKLLPRIGRLVHLEATICSAGGNELPAEQLDQVAADILPHPLSLTQGFLETDISEIDWNASRPTSGELRIFGNDKHGTSFSIFISMNSRPTTNLFRVVGTNGTIHLDLFHGYSLIERGKATRMTKIVHPFGLAARQTSAAAVNLVRRTLRRETAYPGLRELIREFYQSVRLGTGAPITPGDAISIANVRDLVMARTGTGQVKESAAY